MRNISGKGYTENQNIFCAIIFFLPEDCAVCEIMWKNMVEWGRQQMTIWGMRIACWIPKASYTHSEYAILIAFPRQQWLHERALMLRYTTLPFFVCMMGCL
jgi:hypothetical protein